MATKNFAKMTTAKLNALMGTASEEDKALIITELKARGEYVEQAAPMGQAEGQAYNDPDYQPSDEDEKAWAEAEKAEELKAEGKKPEKPAKKTAEELAALCEELKANINHKVTTLDGTGLGVIEGVIIGVYKVTSAGQVFYRVKTTSGEVISRAYNRVNVFDEVVASERKVRESTKKTLTEEEISNMVTAAKAQVGKLVTLANGAVGRITGVMLDKRVNLVMYKITIVTPAEGVETGKMLYRVVSSTDITIEAEFDEEGTKLQERLQARKERQDNPKVTKTIQERFTAAAAALEKAKENLRKAEKTLKARNEAFLKLEAELKAFEESQSAETAETSTPSESEESLA